MFQDGWNHQPDLQGFSLSQCFCLGTLDHRLSHLADLAVESAKWRNMGSSESQPHDRPHGQGFLNHHQPPPGAANTIVLTCFNHHQLGFNCGNYRWALWYFNGFHIYIYIYIPFGNQTWKLNILYIIYKWWVFHCHVWLPEGNNDHYNVYIIYIYIYTIYIYT